MKKYFIIGCIWMMFLMTCIHGISKSNIEYKIVFDSHTKDTYEIKDQIQNVYAKLVSGVHKESYIVMVLNNLDLFEVRDDLSVVWKDNCVYVVQGDGKGIQVEGELVANSICVPEVQPRSFIKEILGL